MMEALEWVVARGREPSTYAGLAGLVSVILAWLGLPADDAASWTKDITMFGVGLFSVLAMVMKEKGI